MGGYGPIRTKPNLWMGLAQADFFAGCGRSPASTVRCQKRSKTPPMMTEMSAQLRATVKLNHASRNRTLLVKIIKGAVSRPVGRTRMPTPQAQTGFGKREPATHSREKSAAIRAATTTAACTNGSRSFCRRSNMAQNQWDRFPGPEVYIFCHARAVISRGSGE